MARSQGNAAVMTPLEMRLRARICRDGPIPVSDFMAAALGDPDNGYYRKSDPLGGAGDFITAPEISQVFGELIGLWCALCWQQSGAPKPVKLVELGPGRGTLMADALRAAQTVPEFAEACEIHLVETSPVLRASQEAALTGKGCRWHDTLDDVPRGPALVIANEFFDALPIDQYLRTDAGWRLRCIGLDEADDTFCFVAGGTENIDAAIMPAALDSAPPGSLFETCPAGLALAAALGDRMAHDGIASLIIDYGHGQGGTGETLQAVRNHRPHSVLTDPGNADLTAHVDFGALASRAEAAGASVFGPIPQGEFLGALGIEIRTEQLAANADAKAATLLRSGCRRLIDSGSMGMLFKVLALTGNAIERPTGFESLRR